MKAVSLGCNSCGKSTDAQHAQIFSPLNSKLLITVPHFAAWLANWSSLFERLRDVDNFGENKPGAEIVEFRPLKLDGEAVERCKGMFSDNQNSSEFADAVQAVTSAQQALQAHIGTSVQRQKAFQAFAPGLMEKYAWVCDSLLPSLKEPFDQMKASLAAELRPAESASLTAVLVAPETWWVVPEERTREEPLVTIILCSQLEIPMKLVE